MTKQKQSGFTLVELSIVLVIIGLIIGGVLVGQDMIQSATLKKQLRQIEEHNLALAAFYEKYNFLPGDCGDICDDNGFGLIDYSVDSTNQRDNLLQGMWDDTSDPIGEASTTAGMMAGAGMLAGGYAAEEFPEIYFGAGQIALISDTAKQLYWGIGKRIGNRTMCTTGNCFTPYIAWKIDSTVDDGNPSDGNVRLAAVMITINASNTFASHDHLRMRTTNPASNPRSVGVAPDSDCAPGNRRTATTYSFDDDSNKDCPLFVVAGFKI